ncbi:Uncharacterised protein [Candidatus Gugararchaeum adminiculabundum]|nr:Uncharacterised protein [Candidatus Gugararchaeum adminiculabundum]
MAEKLTTIFVDTFGSSPRIKVLDFFLTFTEYDYSKNDIARETGVSRITLEPIWEELEKEGIIKKTRTVGRARMFRLNKENPTAKILRELDFKLSSAKADEEIVRMKVRAKAETKH